MWNGSDSGFVLYARILGVCFSCRCGCVCRPSIRCTSLGCCTIRMGVLTSWWRNCSSDPVALKVMQVCWHNHNHNHRDWSGRRVKEKSRDGGSQQKSVVSVFVTAVWRPEKKLPSGLLVRTCRGFPFALLWKVHCCADYQIGKLL